MLRWMVATSLAFRLVVVALALGVVALGAVALGSARAETLPEIDPPYIEVQTEALGLSAVEVEQLITAPLEADLLNGVAFVDEIRSDSIPGLSSVVLVFEPGTTLPHARQLVQERLTQAGALPHVSKPPAMLEPVSSARRTMMIGLSSPDLSLIEQSVLARWTIRPKLSGVPGVANVAVFGQRERQLQVQVDPARLAASGVTMEQVISTTGNAMWVSPLTFLEASTPGTGGFIDTPNQRLGVRHVSPITDAASLSQVALEGNPALRLGDVASVVEDHQPLIGDAVTGGESGLMMVVEKYPDANTLEVTRAVEAALEDLRPGLSGLELDTSLYRPASFIETATGNVGLLLGLGLALAALLIGLFFFAWRTALIAVAVIAVSLAGAVAVLLLTGTPLNFLVMLGLVAALAIVIDDALADTGTVRRTRQAAGEHTSTQTTILGSAVRTRSALTYATVIGIAVVVPVFVIPGALGALVAPLAIAYLVAIVISLVIAAALTPALASLLAPRADREPQPSPAQRVLSDRYTRIAPRLVTRAVPALVTAVVLAVAGVALLPALDTSLAPALREPDLLVEFDGAAATSQPEMSRIVAAASAELRTVPGVEDVGAHVGRALLSDQVADVSSGEIWVHLAADAAYDSTAAAVADVVAGYPGLARNVSTYLGGRSADLLTGPSSDLVVRVYGADLATLDAKADEVRQALAGVEGLVEPTVRRTAQDPTIEITVDLAAAQQVGIKPGEVRRAVATQVNGIGVGSIFEEQKVFEVVVRGVASTRSSVTDVENMLIDLPEGGQVRLGDVAAVQVAPSPTVIERESVSRYVDVVAGVAGRSRGAVATDAATALRAVPFPFEYRAEIRTGFDDARGALWQFGGSAIAAVVVILLLLQAAFRSWRLAVLALLVLPVSLVGGLVVALLAGGVLGLGSLVGLAVVLLVAARHLVTLVRHYQELSDDGVAPGRELVATGTRNRLGPIVATTLAVAVALLPIAVSGPIAGLELIWPMAIVVLGGLVTSALLTLFLVPALYLRFAGGRGRGVDDEEIAVPTQRTDDLTLSTSTTA